MSALRKLDPNKRRDRGLPAQLVAALEANDKAAIKRLGWWAPWETAHTGWDPKQPCTAKDFIPYARWLGNEDPDAVAEAFIDLAGEWRPTPAQIRAHLRARNSKAPRENPGLSRDRAATLPALRATAAAVAAGERVCTCGGTPTLSKWDPRPANVLRCARRFRPELKEFYGPGCGGLEPGQVLMAEQAGLIGTVASVVETTSSVSIVEGSGGHVA
jgi:hypothetical protein